MISRCYLSNYKYYKHKTSSFLLMMMVIGDLDMNAQEVQARIAEIVATGLSVEEATKLVNAELEAEKEKAKNEADNAELEAAEKNEDEADNANPEEPSTYETIVQSLIKADGNEYYRNLKVKTAKVTEMENYFMVNLTINRPIRAMVADSNGVFKEGTRNIIFSSNFALGGVIKNTESIAWIGNSLVENAKVFEAIMAGATIDVVSQPVKAGQLYHNPFSTRNNETKMSNDTFINHIIAIRVNGETNEDIRDAKRSMIKDMFKSHMG